MPHLDSATAHVLTEAEWRSRARAHQARVEPWIAPRLARRQHGVRHPVEDFLFDYYSWRPGQLARWHPGVGVLLKGDVWEFREMRGYRVDDSGARVDTSLLPVDVMAAALELLEATASRTASFACFGRHEWAMVYRQDPGDIRHATWPLRLDPRGVAEVVEASDYSLLDQLVGIYDEPYADSSAIPTYRVCQLARKHVTVALSGDGGDEDFIGYRRYRLFAMEEAVRSRVPEGVRRAVFGPLGRWYPKLDWAPRFVRGKTTFQALARGTVDAYLHGVSICSQEMRAQLYSPAFRRELQGYDASEVFHGHARGKSFDDALSLVQYLDYKTYLPGDILTKVDRASMAHSLEVRTPFLDYEFVEWAASLPAGVKLRGGEGKAVLKKALEPVLPREVLYRSKMGFAVPIDVWFRGSLKERLAATIKGPRLAESGIFDPAELARMVDDHHSGRRNHSAPLWTLLMFDGFLRQHEAAGEAGPLAGTRTAA
jgi:hypothetical protein